jgi:nucleotide-binding universal stress UspA family protein
MRVLLATDGSEFSEEAARFLTRFNFSSSDEIIILHVISEIPYDDDYYAQVKHAIKRVAPKILASSAKILKPVSAKIATLEKDGYPDTTIIDTAVDSDAALIVMGARGVKGVKMLILGSSTRAVVINSPKPVLVVKNRPRDISGKMKVLYATDGSETANEAGRLLTSLPLPDDTEITVMHIPISAFPAVPEKYSSEIESLLKEEPEKIRVASSRQGEKIIAQTREDLEKRFHKINILIKPGDPFREILAGEKTLNPDIIAVGCRGLRGIRGMMGSVSRRLLSHSESSVFIGKACGKER